MPKNRLRVHGGVRMGSIDANLDVTLFPGTITQRNATASGSENRVDPIIGARYGRRLGDCFFFNALNDVGGSGIESDFTWQAIAMHGWQFNKWGSAIVGYHGIGTDDEDGGFSCDIINHRPLVGLEFRLYRKLIGIYPMGDSLREVQAAQMASWPMKPGVAVIIHPVPEGRTTDRFTRRLARFSQAMPCGRRGFP